MTHIRIGKLTIIVWDNGLSPGRRQAIIWTNVWILLIRPLGTNFREILIGIQTFSFKKMYLKMASAKWRPFCLGLNVLKTRPTSIPLTVTNKIFHTIKLIHLLIFRVVHCLMTRRILQPMQIPVQRIVVLIRNTSFLPTSAPSGNYGQ